MELYTVRILNYLYLDAFELWITRNHLNSNSNTIFTPFKFHELSECQPVNIFESNCFHKTNFVPANHLSDLSQLEPLKNFYMYQLFLFDLSILLLDKQQEHSTLLRLISKERSACKKRERSVSPFASRRIVRSIFEKSKSSFPSYLSTLPSLQFAMENSSFCVSNYL